MAPITRTETDFGPGAYGASAPNVPGTPTFSDNGSGTIDITWAANGNADEVTYAIYVTADSVGVGYLAADGTDNGASEVWQTLADWGAAVTAVGLTDFVAYTFKVKARNEDESEESAFSSDSAVMNTLPDIDYGFTSEPLSREVTGGNTKVDTDTSSGTEVELAISGSYETVSDVDEYYGDITLTYTLLNNASDDSRVVVEFSEDYDPETETGTWAACTEGTGGDGLTGLETSPAGVAHTFVWDSYTDAGTSEYDTTVYLRVRPYDASPTGGDAGSNVISPSFAVNNRPATITWTNADGYVFDKDTTPVFMAVIPDLKGGSKGFPEISLYNVDSGTVLVWTRETVVSIIGWEYETEPDVWTAMTVAGIPDTVIDGVNRMRYTVQAADALVAGNYYVTGRMGEVRDRG